MVSFELGYEIEKDVFLSSLHSVGLKKNSESHEESEGLRFDSSWGLRIFSFSPHSWQDRNIFL